MKLTQIITVVKILPLKIVYVINTFIFYFFVSYNSDETVILFNLERT